MDGFWLFSLLLAVGIDAGGATVDGGSARPADGVEEDGAALVVAAVLAVSGVGRREAEAQEGVGSETVWIEKRI